MLVKERNRKQGPSACFRTARIWHDISPTTDPIMVWMKRAPSEPSHVLAAGGLLEKETPEGVRLAVVHRTRYQDREGTPGDWVLPKGKLEAGETLEETALREVEEETGSTARIVGPSFTCEYVAGGIPKVVIFFRMTLMKEGSERDVAEVQEVEWLTPREALARLTYDSERVILNHAYPDSDPPPG